jgi:hypothetical protein
VELAAHLNSTILCSSTLDIVTVDSCCRADGGLASAQLVTTLEIDVFEIEGVDVPRNVSSHVSNLTAQWSL